MRTLLITGFEPFGGYSTNPSQQIAEALNGETIAGVHVSSLILPVVYGEDTARVFPALAEKQPIALLSLGLDAGAKSVHVEMFAINHRFGGSPADGLVPIVPDGPAAYFATIDAEQVAKAVREQAGTPAVAHGYAGSYLCNHVFYQSLHHVATERLDCRVGFIHVPPVAETDKAASALPTLETLIAAARAAVVELVQ